MYVSIERDLVIDLSLLVAVTGSGDGSRGGLSERMDAPRTFIHLADGRVLSVRSARESVIRKLRETHL